jgi:hypothetical protein
MNKAGSTSAKLSASPTAPPITLALFGQALGFDGVGQAARRLTWHLPFDGDVARRGPERHTDQRR